MSLCLIKHYVHKPYGQLKGRVRCAEPSLLANLNGLFIHLAILAIMHAMARARKISSIIICIENKLFIFSQVTFDLARAYNTHSGTNISLLELRPPVDLRNTQFALDDNKFVPENFIM